MKYIILNAIITIIVVINSILSILTWTETFSIGDLYLCSIEDKEYLNKKFNIDCDFDYIFIGSVFHSNYRITAVIKNSLPFDNLFSGTKIILETHDENKLEYVHFKEKIKENSLKTTKSFFNPFKIVYIICLFAYIIVFFIRKIEEHWND